MAKSKKAAKAKPKAKAKAKMKKTAAAKAKAPAKAKPKLTAKAKTKAKPTPKTQAKPTMAKAVKTSLQPLNDRLLVQVEGQAEKTAGGIFIPATVADRPTQGKVVASGTGRRNKKGQVRPLDASVGDTVLFSQYAGTKVTIDGNELLILREDEVLGIVT